MYKFLTKSLLFTTLLILLFAIYLNIFGKYIDYFYEKFTTPKQFSLIIGDSRAKGGIFPKVLDSCLKSTDYQTPTYNFSFTIAQSIYGPSYLEAIKRKLNTASNNQLFILQATPWMLANREPETKKESDSSFVDSPPHNMMNMISNPNIEYLIKNFDYFNFKGIFRKNSVLYKDGHSVNNNLPKNELVFQKWKKIQLDIFLKWKNEWRPSEYRMNWLQNTVTYLQQYGTVIIVRMPFDQEFLEIENRFWPEFDIDMEKIANDNKLIYLNYSTKSDWSTFDGHHLDKYGAKLFSQRLSNDIMKY